MRRAFAQVRLRVVFDDLALPCLDVQEAGMEVVAGRLLVIVLQMRAEGEWRRLKICRNPDCQTVFFDTSRNLAGMVRHGAMRQSSQGSYLPSPLRNRAEATASCLEVSAIGAAGQSLPTAG